MDRGRRQLLLCELRLTAESSTWPTLIMPAQAIGMAVDSTVRTLHDPDRRILERCRRGDAGAFEELFRKYQTYVFNICLGMLGNAEDASDVAQETFIKLHRRMDSFRGDASFSTWLYRVAVNLSISHIRKRGRSRLELMEDVQLPEMTEHDEHVVDPRALVEQSENARLVRRILSTLPPEYRAVIVLRHFQQLAYEEIGDILGLNLSQVKTRLFRARKMFKERFGAYLENRSAL